MVTLGLLPPYTAEDVQNAYRTKAKSTHPDRGGDAASFTKLQAAYAQGMEYAQFFSARRKWLGARVEEYVRRESIAGEAERRGGYVELERIDWVRRDLGDDFGQIVDKLVGIHLPGPQIGDDAVDFLVREQASLQALHSLDLSHSRISDQALGRLKVLTSLRRLDLRGTPVSSLGLKLLLPLPDLEWIHLGGTRVSWWGCAWLRWSYPKLQVGVS
jgi:hypothetical protein